MELGSATFLNEPMEAGRLPFILPKRQMVSDLWEDMAKLNALYEELLWPPDDELTFQIDGDKIVIRNIFQEQRDEHLRR